MCEAAGETQKSADRTPKRGPELLGFPASAKNSCHLLHRAFMKPSPAAGLVILLVGSASAFHSSRPLRRVAAFPLWATKYRFSQTQSSVEFVVPLNRNDVREKDVTLRVTPQSVFLAICSETLIDSPLLGSVVPESLEWAIDEEDRVLECVLEKKDTRRWDNLTP